MPNQATKKSPAPKKKVVSSKQISTPKKAPAKKSAAAKPGNGIMSDKNMLANFFLSELKDIYWAEKHLTTVLTKMEKNATANDLKRAFADHRKVTEGHVVRLEQVFGILRKKPVAKKCDAIAGITKEGDEIISETKKGTETRDVGLIFAAQKVEHYEIATYGCLSELARTLGLQNISAIFEKTLAEEKEADAALSKLAVRNINKTASREKEEHAEPGFFDELLKLFGRENGS
jgi:ferritin-like metal-binding protein YciE